MAIDWTEIFKQYKGQWVALKQDEKTVVANGKTAKAALETAKSKGYAKPILTKVPAELLSYVGSN